MVSNGRADGQLGSRKQKNRQADTDSTAVGRSGRRRVESMGGRPVDQESGAEERTGRRAGWQGSENWQDHW